MWPPRLRSTSGSLRSCFEPPCWRQSTLFCRPGAPNGGSCSLDGASSTAGWLWARHLREAPPCPCGPRRVFATLRAMIRSLRSSSPPLGGDTPSRLRALTRLPAAPLPRPFALYPEQRAAGVGPRAYRLLPVGVGCVTPPAFRGGCRPATGRGRPAAEIPARRAPLVLRPVCPSSGALALRPAPSAGPLRRCPLRGHRLAGRRRRLSRPWGRATPLRGLLAPLDPLGAAAPPSGPEKSFRPAVSAAPIGARGLLGRSLRSLRPTPEVAPGLP